MANSKLFSLLSLLFIAVVLTIMQTAMAAEFLRYNCSNVGIIPPKSPYQNNLNKLLGNLSSKAPINSGFSSGSAGQKINKVYGLALCRGDVSTTDCQSCLADARTRIRQGCRNTKGAIIWYDICLLKYSKYNFFGKIDNVNKFYLCGPYQMSYPRGFIPTLNDLLRKLSANAAGRKSLYAAGVATVGSQKVYGLVQCTRDLSGEDCLSCLNAAMGELQNYCRLKEGGRVVGGSCSVRYETYPFFNGQTLNPTPS